jgi:hypothetical protein
MLIIFFKLFFILGYFVILKLRECKLKFDVVHDIHLYKEKNEYRYIRHAAIYGDKIAFCSEIGKLESKISVLSLNDEYTILKEMKG